MASDFLAVSKRFLDLLGADGVGSEWEQRDFVVSGVEPRWVLLPESVGQLAECLRIAAEAGLSVIPAGRGQRLAQGLATRNVDVVLSTSRLDAVLEHAAADLTVVAAAGATLAGVNEALAREGQWLAFDPPFPRETTIGGLIAAQPTGPRRQRFGTVRESLIGLQAVLADGTVVRSGGRVVKNVAGYDLHRLLVGSFGTLAVVVEAAFRCRPLPPARERVVVEGALPVLFRLASRLSGSYLEPEMLEVLVPEQGAARLVVEVTGSVRDVRSASRRISEMAGEQPGLAEGPVDVDVGASVEAVARPEGSSAVVLRAGVAPATLVAWLGVAIARASRSGRVSAHAHAGVGVARLRIEEAEAVPVRRLLATLREAAAERGGYVVVEHAPAQWALDPWGPPPVTLELMRATKHAFDPAGRLGGGRFVGAL